MTNIKLPQDQKDTIACAENLIRKAEKAHDGGEAMRFSQAAVNVTNAVHQIHHIKSYKTI